MTTKNMKKSIKRLCVSDFDGTLCDSPMPDVGKKIYKENNKKKYYK